MKIKVKMRYVLKKDYWKKERKGIEKGMKILDN